MHIYHGWKVVAASITAYMLVMGSTVNSFSLFVIPVSTELGLSRTGMNTAYILLNIGNGIFAAVVGRMLNSFSARRTLAASAALLGLGFGLLSLSDSLGWSAFALGVLLPLGVNGSAMITLNVLVARWFVIHRTRAMALSTLGLSLGAVVMPPVMAALIAGVGWRPTLSFTGAAIAMLLFTMALTLRERPEADDIEPGPHEAPDPRQTHAASIRSGIVAHPPQTIAQVLRSRPFWFISLSAALILAIFATLAASMAPIAIAKGLTMIQATSVITLSGVTAVISTLLLASLAGKKDPRSLLAGLFPAAAALNGAFILSNDYASLLGCAAFLGLISGPAFPLFQALLVDQFGASSFGLVRGLTIPVNAVCVAAAMRFAGEVFDRTGSYTPMLIAFVAIAILAAVGMHATRFVGRSCDAGALATKQQ